MTRITYLTDKDKKQNKKMYDIYHNEIKWIDGWEKSDKIHNFNHMVKIARLTDIPLEGKNCLDVGCGTGDFVPFLRKQKINKYLGVDIYEPAISRAREKYPREQFVLGDILTDIIQEKFHYAFASGTFSIDLQINNYDFLESMTAKMWEMTTVGLVFNCFIDEEVDRDPDLFYFNFNRLQEICENIIQDQGKLHALFDHDIYQVHIYLYRI